MTQRDQVLQIISKERGAREVYSRRALFHTVKWHTVERNMYALKGDLPA